MLRDNVPVRNTLNGNTLTGTTLNSVRAGRYHVGTMDDPEIRATGERCVGPACQRGHWQCKSREQTVRLGEWLMLAAALCLAIGPGVLWAEDGGSTGAPHGLLVRFHAEAQDEAILSGVQGAPRYWLHGGEAPDPRLPPTGWRTVAEGQLDAILPGEYQFSAVVSGRLRVELAGQPLIDVESDHEAEQTVTSESVKLESKLHPLRIEYAPGANGARLQIQWRHERFGWEPLPTAALVPAAAANAVGQSPEQVPHHLLDEFGQGWAALTNHRCLACHGGPLRDAMPPPRGPNLQTARQRLRREWLADWLADPAALRPEATMPRLFAADRQGEIERQAVAEYLTDASLPADDSRALPTAEDRTAGAELFSRIGCANCHQAFTERRPIATLTGLAAKFSARSLDMFLKDPTAVFPDGRMPRFDLSDVERRQLTAFLLTKDMPNQTAASENRQPADNEVATALRRYASADVALAALPADEQRRELARRVIVAKRCELCHELPADERRGKPALAATELNGETTRLDDGCLAHAAAARESHVPAYGTSVNRETVAAFLRQTRQPLTPSPGFLARQTVARLHCTACHAIENQPGLPREVEAMLLAGQSESSAEAVHPPSLTGVAEKLTLAALSEVLLQGRRVRPWMTLRMPHFSGVDALPQRLAALAAVPRAADKVEMAVAAEADETILEAARGAGRTLVGARGFGCIKCHDLQGIASTGTRGPDLALTPRRIQRDWYERWMRDPQRIAPGTRMPTVFLDGQSPHLEILEGDPTKQRDAIWQYLLASHAMPLPEGVERSTPQRVAIGQRPVVVRTFLPGLSARGMAVGFANDVHLLYDAQTCRLAGMFEGGFLDLSAAWSGRGGAAARVEGSAVWTSPASFHWEITAPGSGPPDLRGRAQDPALGGPVRESPPYAPSRLQFSGYTLDTAGPTFRFTLNAAAKEGMAQPANAIARFVERLSTVRTDLGIAARRSVTIDLASRQRVWLHVADCDTAPMGWPASTKDATIPMGADPVAASGSVVQMTQAGQTFLVWAAGMDKPQWQSAQRDGVWQLFLGVDAVAMNPPAGESATLAVEVWRPSNDRAETVANLARFLQERGDGN